MEEKNVFNKHRYNVMKMGSIFDETNKINESLRRQENLSDGMMYFIRC